MQHLQKTRGARVFLPIWKTSCGHDDKTRFFIQVISFQTLAHSSALFCTFLHSRKTQLFYFQSIPHSASKNTTTREVRPELQTGCCQLSKRGEMGTGARGAPVPEVGL